MKSINNTRFFDISAFQKNLNKKQLKKYYTSFCVILEIAQLIDKNNWRTFLVWWTIRDILMWIMPKDFDIEIHGLLPEKIEDIVASFWKISNVGKSFWITKLSVKNWIEIDISVPRRDSKIWIGHRWFNIDIDTHMWIEEACKRRDFTMNSIAFDLITNEIYDPYGWMHDIEDNILKITNPETFIDDPLRVLRCMQFISRFWSSLDTESIPTIQSMIPFLKELPKERIWEEWRKLLLKSKKPSVWLKKAMELWILEVLHPELSELKKTEQDPIWHPEWNVWIHTMMVIDQIQDISQRDKLAKDTHLLLALAALCHDLWKPKTTKIVNNKITSYNHEAEWIIPTKTLLASIDIPSHFIDKIVPLVQYHLLPIQFYQSEKSWITITNGAIRRLAQKLFPASIYELVLLAEADYFWRWGRSSDDIFLAWKWLLDRALVLSVDLKKPENIISWKELIEMGYKSGREVWELITLANTLRDNDELSKDEILKILKIRLVGDSLRI